MDDSEQPRLTGPDLPGLTDSLRPSEEAHFDAMYLGGTPPWDIGRPQPALLELANRGAFVGHVLDVGCGTGEHAILAAQLGLEATGIDSSSKAIEIARSKARERGVSVRFEVGDALRLDELGTKFETVIDSGLFHVFDDEARDMFVRSLHAAMLPGSRYHLLCFSDLAPGEMGPRRITQQEIRSSFAEGWEVEKIDPSNMAVTLSSDGMPAWLSPDGMPAWRATIARI